MGAVIFSDVHADAAALAAVAACIRRPAFSLRFGSVDLLINLGDILHRGNHPRETLEQMQALAKEFHLVSVMGNHDHAFLNNILVSGSDAVSTHRHEQLRGSPLLSIFDTMPMEFVHDGILFVHGGPLDLGPQTLRLKCWQRLAYHAGDAFTGYHYTAPMAFEALASRGLTHMICGHQHDHVCCRKTSDGISQYPIRYELSETDAGRGKAQLETAEIPLDMPTLLRVGGCYGPEPEFAYTDFSRFWYIRVRKPLTV